MPEYTPTVKRVKRAYVAGMRLAFGEHAEEFDRWLAEVERAAAEKAWDDGHRAGELDAGDGLASLFSGLDAPKPRRNPYRRNEGEVVD